MAKAVQKARRSFVPEGAVRLANVCSHSGRHRAINDMKVHGLPSEVGRRMARISEERVWQQYGKMSDSQAAHAMLQNTPLQEEWMGMYAS